MKRAICILLLAGCSASHQTATTGNKSISKPVEPPLHSWTIDDTFFYKADGSFLQYPRIIYLGDSSYIKNCWFGNRTFLIIIDDTVYTMPPKDSFHYSKLIQ